MVKSEKRTYKVVSVEEAKGFGAKPLTLSDWNRFALVAVRGESLDNVIVWGHNKDNLQKMADARNNDIAMLGKMIDKRSKAIDNGEEI